MTSPATLVSKGRHCHWDYLSPSRLIVLNVGYLNFAHNGLQHANSTLTYFLWASREKSNVKPLRKYLFDKVKIKCQFQFLLSAWQQPHVQFKRFANGNVKQFTSFDIAYHTQMIYKPVYISETCFGYLF